MIRPYESLPLTRRFCFFFVLCFFLLLCFLFVYSCSSALRTLVFLLTLSHTRCRFLWFLLVRLLLLLISYPSFPACFCQMIQVFTVVMNIPWLVVSTFILYFPCFFYKPKCCDLDFGALNFGRTIQSLPCL